jgi:hypothetical protein
MCLRLKESNTAVQLIRYGLDLVLCWKTTNKSRIVSADKGDVRIYPVAKCGRSVAR